MNRVGEENVNNFGSKMIITKYRNNANVDIYFPEYSWTLEHETYQNFKNGNIKCPYEQRHYGIGYIGEGSYRSRDKNKKKTKCYNTWKNMLKRCYDLKVQEKQPAYVGCEVCDEWYNFQNFAQWYEENYYEVPGQRMELDKDILYKGNKIYSPDTCVFVPQSINTLFTKSDTTRGDLPIGVSYHKQHKKYQSRCTEKGGRRKHLGYYDTPEEAFVAYKTFKENYIKQIADQYVNLIPQSLYNAMINYEVEEDD